MLVYHFRYSSFFQVSSLMDILQHFLYCRSADNEFPHFHSLENVATSSLFLKDILAGHIFFGTLKVLFHDVLPSVVLMSSQLSFSKSSFPVHTVPLPPRSPHTFDILSLCFSSLTVMCPGVVLFMFILLGV